MLSDLNISSIEQSSSRVFHVDAEHGGIRFVVFVIFMVFLVLSYILLSVIFQAEGLNVIAIFGSFLVAGVISSVTERQLKHRWPSGRKLHILPDKIDLIKNGKAEITLDPSKQVNVLFWRFTIQRRARVPKGWHMIACALEQDGTHLPVYTFLSPDDFKEFPMADQFPPLPSKKDLNKTASERDMRMAGQNRRLHAAESERWMYGAEMTQEQFYQYLDHLKSHFPKWMPQKP